MQPQSVLLAEDSDDPFERIKKYLGELNIHPTGWVLTVFIFLILATIFVGLMKPLVPVLRYGWIITKWMAKRRLSAERRNQRKRRMFAKHLNNQLLQLELQEDWRDEKYAELEAEVEIERSWRYQWMRLFLPFRTPVLRRVRSLSRALAKSSESLILLEGEPGAGKSIALRHLARMMAQWAAKRKNPQTVIPLYLNLKTLDIRPADISADKIRQFVLDTLTSVNSRDVQEVLDDSFDRGMDEGTWLFLFDSFDEIPDILGADDARLVAPKYARAIADFLAPFSRCRGIVASRDFSTPDITQYIRFRILRLSRRQQDRLIKRADLDRPVDRALRTGLETASKDVSTFAGNPMFLGLLCEHMKNGRGFPVTSHAVFEEYLTHRLQRDAERIMSRYGVSAEFVRAGAEEVAFVIAATPGMSLKPTRAALLAKAATLHRVSPTTLNTILDALEYSKLGRDNSVTGGDTFEFMHRRFQEYFATCVVIDDSRRVPVAALFDNDQWRETAVTLLQVQSAAATEPLMAEAHRRLRHYVANLDSAGFQWPPGCRHLLGILATGLETHPEKITDDMRSLVDQILERAWDQGHRLDKRRALAYVGLASDPVTERLLSEAFRSRNEFLREGAFRAAGSLPALSDNLRAHIRRSLLGLAGTFELYTSHGSTIAQIKRLPAPVEFLRILSLLTVALPMAAILSVGGMFAGLLYELTIQRPETAVSVVVVILDAVILMLGVSIVRKLFSIAGLNRGGRLVTSILRGTLHGRIVRVLAQSILLTLNALLCTVSTGALAGLIGANSVPEWIVLSYFVYAALWPAAVSWGCRTGIGIHPLLWPLLPLLLMSVGSSRFPAFVKGQDSILRATHPQPLRAIYRALVDIVRPALPKIARGLAVSPLLIAFLAIFVLATGHKLGIVGYVAAQCVAIAALVAIALIIVMVTATNISLYRGANRVRTSTDLLALVARASMNASLNLLISRFSFQRVTADPAVCRTVERLVGEIEQAQVRAEVQSKLLMRAACPSLAACDLPTRWLLESFVFRDFTTLQVRDIREETIDDLARLAETELG
jgi:hypothetical protein